MNCPASASHSAPADRDDRHLPRSARSAAQAMRSQVISACSVKVSMRFGCMMRKSAQPAGDTSACDNCEKALVEFGATQRRRAAPEGALRGPAQGEPFRRERSSPGARNRNLSPDPHPPRHELPRPGHLPLGVAPRILLPNRHRVVQATTRPPRCAIRCGTPCAFITPRLERQARVRAISARTSSSAPCSIIAISNRRIDPHANKFSPCSGLRNSPVHVPGASSGAPCPAACHVGQRAPGRLDHLQRPQDARMYPPGYSRAAPCSVEQPPAGDAGRPRSPPQRFQPRPHFRRHRRRLHQPLGQRAEIEPRAAHNHRAFFPRLAMPRPAPAATSRR
jgi:hypothetical protein